MAEKEDPELLDDDNEGVGGEHFYNGLAVQSVPYEPMLFELPDDFEVTDDD